MPGATNRASSSSNAAANSSAQAFFYDLGSLSGRSAGQTRLAQLLADLDQLSLQTAQPLELLSLSTDGCGLGRRNRAGGLPAAGRELQHMVGTVPGVAFLLAVTVGLAATVEPAGQPAGTQVAQRGDLPQNAIALLLELLDIWQIFHAGSSMSLL